MEDVTSFLGELKKLFTDVWQNVCIFSVLIGAVEFFSCFFAGLVIIMRAPFQYSTEVGMALFFIAFLAMLRCFIRYGMGKAMQDLNLIRRSIGKQMPKCEPKERELTLDEYAAEVEIDSLRCLIEQLEIQRPHDPKHIDYDAYLQVLSSLRMEMRKKEKQRGDVR